MSDETTELQSLSKLKIAGRLRYWRGTIEIPETELHAICDEIQAEHEQAIAATLGVDVKDCENLLWEFIGALDVADATDADKKPIVSDYARHIAATLGSERHPYEQRITGDGSDWGEIMRDAYDDLMASACESCTPEQMRQLADYIRAELGSATLTAEQVRETVEKHWHDLPYEYDMPEATALPEYSYDWQAIADELNAAIGGGECENVSDEPQYFQCSECRGRGTIRKAFDNRSRFSFCPDCGRKIRKAVKR